MSYYNAHSIYRLQIPLGDGRGREPATRGGCRRDRFGWAPKERGRQEKYKKKNNKEEADVRVTADGTCTNAASDGFDGDGDDTERRAPFFVANFIRWVARSGAPLVSTSLDSLPSAPLPH